MAKIKFSKSEEGGADFIEKRRASLERYNFCDFKLLNVYPS